MVPGRLRSFPAMPEKASLLEELDWLSDKISSQVWTLNLTFLAATWSLLIGGPALGRVTCRSATFPRKKEADAFHATVRVDVGRGVHTPHSKSTETNRPSGAPSLYRVVQSIPHASGVTSRQQA